MTDSSYLKWPFFDDRHREFARFLDAWAAENIGLETREPSDLDAECIRLARLFGDAGLIDSAAPQAGAEALDVRTICLTRETLARHSALADVVYAMQGLGSGPITLFGAPAIRERFLPRVRSGRSIAAFALSEAEAGSDVAAMTTTATRVADGWKIDGVKTWISNAGVAGHYVVFARTGEASGAKGISAFVVEGDHPGVSVVERLRVISPHPIGTVKFENCVVPHDCLLGEPGQGFEIAMATLDVFRSSVAAAALGFARRGLDEAIHRADTRIVMRRPLIEQQLIQGKIADMALAVDASAMFTYRSAWTRDVLKQRITRESSMAKLYATEAAQRVVDEAVQIFGGLGVTLGNKPEELYRDVRALRIYEGASEVQRVIIARQTMAAAGHPLKP
ncbi:MAG: acyl-CoA dehydrogenase family protein [Roseiarcus sp.]|jgi:acyl-CoA dehydrogenase